MKIHQFVHTLTFGDAISGEAIAIRRILRELGFESEIYSIHSHEKVREHTRPWTQFTADAAAARAAAIPTAVVLHYSIGSPLNDVFLSEPGILRAMIFHNLTPEKWFTHYNPRVAKDLRRGFEELPTLLQQVDLAVADSHFNRREIEALGARDVRVLPLVLDEGKWQQVAANSGIAAAVRGHGGKNILHVGRMAPNKSVQDIVRAFYFYHHKIEPKSRLWLVGSDIDTEIYSFEIRRLVSELRLKEAVTLVGSVDDTELRAFYECSDLYLCMSEHEGFCVPLIEAMYFGVPVIAYNSSAVPETLGSGGLLLAEKRPAEVAELIHTVMNDGALRAKMVRHGHERVQEFRPEKFVAKLREMLIQPLADLSMSRVQAPSPVRARPGQC